MKFKTLSGREKSVNIAKYLVDWDAKERSKIQFNVKRFLYPYWRGHVVCAELRVAGTRMTFDLVNMTRHIAIEVQGRQHTEFTPFFHENRSNYLQQIKRDLNKEKFCELNGLSLVEIFPGDIPLLSPEWFEEKYNVML